VVSARLVILLPGTPDASLRWTVCSPYGDVLGAGEGTPVLPAGVTVAATIAVMPQELVHLRQISLPARTERAAQQAAPFAMEEHLAAPLETQRIVCGPAGADGQRLVAAIGKELAQVWQASLEKAAARPVFAVSQAMLLDPADGELAMAPGDSGLVWRYRSGSLDMTGAIPEEFHQLLFPALMDALQPDKVTLAAGQDGEYRSLHGIEPYRTGPFDPVQAAAGMDLALLAGLPPVFGARLAASVDWISLFKPWRRVAALAGLTLCLALAGIAVEAAWLSGESRRLEDSAQTAFAEAFPDVRRIVNPRVQLAQRLREVEAVEGGSDTFLTLAGALAGVMEDAPQIDVIAVRFQADDPALSVTARYNDYSDFEILRAAAETAGIVLDDAGARQGADGIEAEFTARWRE